MRSGAGRKDARLPLAISAARVHAPGLGTSRHPPTRAAGSGAKGQRPIARSRARARKTLGGKRNVAILSVDPVGNYAVRIRFDDMHATGIYSWAFLHDLGLNAERRLQDYFVDLQAKGLDRDRPGVR